MTKAKVYQGFLDDKKIEEHCNKPKQPRVILKNSNQLSVELYCEKQCHCIRYDYCRNMLKDNVRLVYNQPRLPLFDKC